MLLHIYPSIFNCSNGSNLDRAVIGTGYPPAAPRPLLPLAQCDTCGCNSSLTCLYCFSHSEREQQYLLRRSHSGGATINDWGWHAVNHDAPFGGAGKSGMGAYHGQEGFRELSHAKSVFRRLSLYPTQLFHPPYGNVVQRLALRFFLGKHDPSLKTGQR